MQRCLGPERGGRSPGWRCVGGRRGLQPHAHGRPRLAAAARADRNLKAQNRARRGRSERGAGRGGACGRPTSGNPRPAEHTLSNRIARRASLALCQRFLRTVRLGTLKGGADVLTSGSRASCHVTEGGPAEGRLLGGGNGANDRTCHRIASLLGTPCHCGEAWASQERSWKNRRSKACCGLGPGSHCKSGGLLPTPPDTTSKFPSAGAEAFKRSRRETDCPLVHVVRVCP